MRSKISGFLPWVLVLISLVIALRNYSPGTYLSGWDTLHPEFDFSLNFSRVFQGVFRDEQGLGAVAGHSHMSEIPRILELYILNFVFPKELLRYISILSALFIGPLGTYFFVLKLTKDRLIAFFGGLFYLLNLGALQQFIVPFEMFTTQYAFLPWLFLSVLNYLNENTRKNLLIFLIFTFLASPMAYAATLWYAYFISLVLFLLSFYLANKNREILKRSLRILFLTILINLFWILPNIYFVLNHAQEVSGSKINTLFTEEAFAQNVSFGDIKDIALFKGFLFNWGIYQGDSRFGQVLEVWQKHLDNPYAKTLGFLFFAIILVGIVNEIRKKNKSVLPILPVFLLSFFFLLNINPPLGFIFQFVQEHIPFFREAIRFPFTKFSILFIFSSSVFFAYGLFLLISTLQKKIRYINIIVFIIVLFSLFYYMWPAFYGNMVSPFMRVKIPSEYFEMFSWFKKEPQGRIAYLPIHSFWGWEYYKWSDSEPSYQGAGFLWFGLKQPILHRDFDRWTPTNEQYYREMSYAIYTKNLGLFKSVLSKYDISYILIDKSVIAPGLDSKILFLNEIEDLISQDQTIKRAGQFGKNIYVYKLPSNDKTYTLGSVKVISPKFGASYEDTAYQRFGPYITPPTPKTKSISIPFRNIIDNQNKFLKDAVKLNADGLAVEISPLKNTDFEFPRFEDLEKVIAADIFAERDSNLLRITLIPKFPKSSIPLTTSAQLPTGEKNFLLSINQRSFVLNDPPPNTSLFLGTVYLNTNSDNTITLYEDKDDLTLTPDFSTINFSLNSCDSRAKGILTVNPKGNNLELSAKNSDLCLMTSLSNLISGYQNLQSEEILIGSKLNSQGSSISFPCIASLKTDACISHGLRSADLTFFPIQKDEVNYLGLKIFLPRSENPNGEKISYNNVSFGLRKPIFFAKFGKDVLSLSLDYLRLTKGEEIKVAFTGSDQYSLDILKLPQTSGDCQNNPGPLAPTKKVVKVKENNYIRYTAENGSFCDHFSFPNLSQNQSYAIIVESRNITGLPIRLCVANTDSKRCDLYTHLGSSKNFTKDIFLLPPMSKDKAVGGYVININNLGVKNIPSINDISSIYIIPFPYNWLSEIVSKGDSDTTGKIFVLSNSYEVGFKAYEVKNKGLLSSIFPFTGNSELKDHVLVNNWANGWSLNEEIEPDSITILFIPQYLEYLGFFLWPLNFIFFIRK